MVHSELLLCRSHNLRWFRHRQTVGETADFQVELGEHQLDLPADQGLIDLVGGPIQPAIPKTAASPTSKRNWPHRNTWPTPAVDHRRRPNDTPNPDSNKGSS